jgi:thiol-disulfide isomerase/thioredoxin
VTAIPVCILALVLAAATPVPPTAPATGRDAIAPAAATTPAAARGAAPAPAATDAAPAPAAPARPLSDAPPPAAPAPAAAPGDAAQPLALGSAMPMSTTRMRGVDGRAITLAAAAGSRGTLVVFMCNHCPWVKLWQGRIAAIANAAKAAKIGVVAINSNDPAAYPEDGFDQMKARAKQLGFKFPYVVDATSDVARAFGATRTPEVFLFDAGGKLVYHGAVDDNARDEQAVEHAWLHDAVDAVVGGTPVPAAESKALGCGIKLRARKST